MGIWTTLGITFLGSGIGAAIVGGVFQILSAGRLREFGFLQEQLRGLYGPLYFFICQNRCLMDTYNKYHEAGHKEFQGQEASEARSEKFTAIIKDANAYADMINENNQEVMQVLKKGWHLIDPEDVEAFSRFQVDYFRHTRLEKEDRLTVEITYEHLGDIYVVSEEMTQLAEKRFRQKSDRLKQLSQFCFVKMWI